MSATVKAARKRLERFQTTAACTFAVNPLTVKRSTVRAGVVQVTKNKVV